MYIYIYIYMYIYDVCISVYILSLQCKLTNQFQVIYTKKTAVWCFFLGT